MRTLAREYASGLRALGHEVLLVTSDQHPQKVEALDWEIVLDPRPKRPQTWPIHMRESRRIKRFDADIVVTELVRDPRWIALCAGIPRVDVVHDDRPHDAGERRPAWERALFGAWNSRADTASGCPSSQAWCERGDSVSAPSSHRSLACCRWRRCTARTRDSSSGTSNGLTR